jgi:Fe-S oxidoreductase
LKAELLHGRIQRDGLTPLQRVVSSLDELGKLGCAIPTLANAAVSSLFVRSFLNKTLGLAWQRPPPLYARTRFDRWFKRKRLILEPTRGKVILWDDTFVRYHEPHIGMAAVKVLEAAGFEVTLATGRKCCGRPAFSQGHLDKAKREGAHNLALLARTGDAPILFLEPSCYSMFVEDYPELNLTNTEPVARRCFLFEQFIENLLTNEPAALEFAPKPANVVIHAHCHLKALMKPGFLLRLAHRLPQRNATLLDSGCCGMAGAFGAMASKYELSLKVAEPLAQKVRGQPFGTVVVAGGASCRNQISHLAPVRPRHFAEVLAEALA